MINTIQNIIHSACISSSAEQFDYYLSASGSDSNDGLTEETAFLTMSKVQEKITAVTSGQTLKIAVLAGTYEGQWEVDTSFQPAAETTITVKCFGKVIFDNTNFNTGAAADSLSFFSNDGNANVKFYFYGNPVAKGHADRTEIKGDNAARFNNGLGTSASGKLYAYDLDIYGYYDGVSSHNTSYIYGSNLHVWSCGKAGAAMVNTSTYQFDNCMFEGKQSAVVSAFSSDAGTTGILNDCEIYNPSGVTTTTSLIQLKNVTANRCKIGKLTQGSYNLYGDVDNSTFNDCFFNWKFQHYLNTTLNRCYGILTIRPRGPITDTITIDHCVFKIGYEEGVLINYNNYTATTDPGGDITLRNSILFGFTDKVIDADNNSSRHTHINDNWTITNNCLYNNTNPIPAAITIVQNSVEADPLLVDPTTEDQDDWKVQAGSPCVGAGTGGSDIGIGVAS
jgi:hypothetical protein